MWQIWTDTGGTFTDCIARSPAGKTKRLKVLSSSRLRGQITKISAPAKFQFAHNWPVKKPIFVKYKFRIPSLSEREFFIKKIDFGKNEITLDSAPVFKNEPQFPLTFEITAHEEAPVLAARLATGTPLGQALPPLEMRLGTTRGTNALLEKKGAKTALLITKGFKDLTRIGTQQRPQLFQLDIPAPALLHEQVFEVNERLDANGDIIEILQKKEIRRLLRAVKKTGIQSVAIALLHAWRNPVHELALKAAFGEAGIPFLSLSHELMPAIKLLPRCQTALVNAYLHPVIDSYLQGISTTLFFEKTKAETSQKLRVMTSAGGLANAASFYPKDSLLSGPAGGVVGAAAISQTLGFQKVITLDMGGTSTDSARYDGHFDYSYSSKIAGTEMLSPCLSIETVAAGGGSICHFDGQKLCVGPESAGADPGPACYGTGGPLTITDVNLLLGKLDPSAMGIPVDKNEAASALRSIQKSIFKKTKTRIPEGELLRGFERIANEKMAGAIRKISVSKGFDPKDYALLAFGGAGGLHACKIAELLGITTLILPYDGGLLSAFGIGQAGVSRMAQRQVLQNLSAFGPKGLPWSKWLPETLQALVGEASASLEKEGFAKNEIQPGRQLMYLRLQGQESSLELDLGATGLNINEIEAAFEKKYGQLFGHYPGGREVEVESLKVSVFSLQSGSPQSSVSLEKTSKPLIKGEKKEKVFWDDLKEGQQLEGPAILLNKYSTAYLEKDWQMEAASFGLQSGSPQSSVSLEKTSKPLIKGEKKKKVFWDDLKEGQQMEGPAILLNKYSTAYLEKDWQMEVASGKNLILKHTKTAIETPSAPRPPLAVNRQPSVNPIELELFTNRFSAIAEEMGAQLQRTAFSVNIKERLDFSCALLDADGELLVNAPHIPVHLGSLGICARLVLEKLELGPGDVAIVNHPKYGGSHLPDITLLSAVFENTSIPNSSKYPSLIGYVINRAHHAEIGGKRPGSMPPDAVVLEEEGVVFAPTYLVRKGETRWTDIEEMLIGSPYPTRSLHENLADINAALASLLTGAQKLQKLVAEHGPEKVKNYMAKLKETAADVLREALKPFDNQYFTAIEKLDDGHEIHVKTAIKNGQVGIDFSGTSAVHPFNLNANISIVYSAVIYVLRLLCGKDIPLNEGLMKNVKIHLPEARPDGSGACFLHPRFVDNPARCPAVVGGNTEVSQRLVDALLKAFAPIAKTACSQGTMNNFLFGNGQFGYYETIGGGTGAGDGFDGRSAVHQHMTNTKITDPEELELRYPVRLHRFAIRKNSGGKGRWKGGDGIVREMEFLEEVDMTIISQHRKTAPYGLENGRPGKRGKQYLIKKENGEKVALKGVDSRRLQKGDRVVVETPGGGGYGEESD
ncbi:MAG TPA: 5-oxoprolinase [Bacteroidetes bacterium]|nr:5-oxoprolinase [Bacteroidota bacterium]